ncbi:MAG: YihY/virulence factor BrkB family protein [Bacteroidota bacterium]
MQKILTFFKDVFTHFSKSNTFQEGAALAYYTVFSLLPMLMITVSIFGMIWGEAAVAGDLNQGLKDVLGQDMALQVEEIIKQQHTKHNGFLTTIIGIITLALGASGMFNQLHTAFNNIWGLKPSSKNGLLVYLTKHLSSFLLLIVTFFLLLLSLSINSFITRHGAQLPDGFPLSLMLEYLVSYLLVALVFTLMFKYLGNAIVHWQAALLGGLFTSFLFLAGKSLIALYIGHSNIATTFGAASVLALIMVWVYYTSQMLFLGASFVYIVSKRLGQVITETN